MIVVWHKSVPSAGAEVPQWTGPARLACVRVHCVHAEWINLPPLRERCEWRHAVGVVLSLSELRPEAATAQQVLSDEGQPGLPHLCVWTVLSHLVLHHHGGGAGTYSIKQGILTVNALHQHLFKIFTLSLSLASFFFSPLRSLTFL